MLETFVRDHLMEHFLNNKFFTNRQFGFLKGRSTVTQLLNILDNWTLKLEQGGKIDVIYTDFEKAFDKVPHKRLLSKLRSYQVDENIIKWIEAFLICRKQRVAINGIYSLWTEVLSGIPQGSILGPLLFIIYINDIVEFCGDDAMIFLFADDAKIYKHITSPADCIVLQEYVDKFSNWTQNWLVKLNVQKCKTMSIYHRRHTIEQHQYEINNSKLETVDTFRDLGVIFDHHLIFDQHICEKVNKAYSMLGILKRNFKNMSRDCFLILYKSMVRSHLEYAQSIWSPIRLSDIEKIEKVQKRATKSIHGMGKLSYKERLEILKLPTLKFRRLRGDMIELYKFINGKYDQNTSIHIPLYSELQSSIQTRGHRVKLLTQTIRYDTRKHYFINRCISIWNSLPEEVVVSESVNIFKNKLDRLWCMQDLYFDYTARSLEAGSRYISLL